MEKISDIIFGFNKIINLSSISPQPQLPATLILMGAPKRGGMSAIKLASRIIARKAEVGLPVGALATGEPSPDELMIRIMAEEFIKMLHEDAVVNIGIPPGITVSAAGISPAGPVTVFGATQTPSSGYGIIQ